MRAETLSSAVNCRKGLLGGNRSVPAGDRRLAIVTIAAGRVIGFSEIAEEDLPPAGDCLAVPDQRLDLLPLDPALAIGCLTCLEQAKQTHHIGHAVGHPGVCRQPVPSGAARFLVIGFEVFRHVEMGDETDIRLVDPHAEGDRRGDDDPFLPEEALLMMLAHRGFEAGMIGQRSTPARAQPSRGLLGRASRETVNDSSIGRMFRGEKMPQLLQRALLRDDAVEQVRSVVPRGENPRFRQPQLCDDVAPRRAVRGRGQRHDGHPWEALFEDRELLVLLAEIVPPLRDAVRLVNGKKGEASVRQQLQTTRCHQPLRRDIEEIEGGVPNSALDRGSLGRRQPRVEGRRAHPRLAQSVNLVLHQRDQRGYHDADARTQQRRDLVTHRLAAAGRHQHDGVAAGNDVLDDRELLAAEAVEPENLAEHSLGASCALAVHRQIRSVVSGVGPVRNEIAGITRNTLSAPNQRYPSCRWAPRGRSQRGPRHLRQLQRTKHCRRFRRGPRDSGTF